MAEQEGLTLRHPVPEDQPAVLAVLDEWWGGQGGAAGATERASLLPLLFFQHFTDTSFVAESDGRLAGFLIGFMSQSRPDESYIHFVKISPDLRGEGLDQAEERRQQLLAAGTLHACAGVVAKVDNLEVGAGA